MLSLLLFIMTAYAADPSYQGPIFTKNEMIRDGMTVNESGDLLTATSSKYEFKIVNSQKEGFQVWSSLTQLDGTQDRSYNSIETTADGKKVVARTNCAKSLHVPNAKVVCRTVTPGYCKSLMNAVSFPEFRANFTKLRECDQLLGRINQMDYNSTDVEAHHKLAMERINHYLKTDATEFNSSNGRPISMSDLLGAYVACDKENTRWENAS